MQFPTPKYYKLTHRQRESERVVHIIQRLPSDEEEPILMIYPSNVTTST